jgi:hypothetical protein
VFVVGGNHCTASVPEHPAVMVKVVVAPNWVGRKPMRITEVQGGTKSWSAK